MSARFWTKILTEIKTQGKDSKNTNKWRRASRKLAFNQETLYRNDIMDGVYNWLQRVDTRMPKQELTAFNKDLEALVDEYLDIMYQRGLKNGKIKATRTSDSVVFIFPPQAAPKDGGTGTGNKQLWEAYNQFRRKELGVLGNKILRTERNSKNYNFSYIVGTDGVRRAQAYSSSNALDKQAGISDALHGDLKQGVKSTVASYKGRSKVAEESNRRRKIRNDLAETMYRSPYFPTTYMNFQVEAEFDRSLLDFIDTEYGFEVLQDNPIDGSKLKDTYVLIQTTRGTQKENKRMQQTGADKDKVFDQMIEEGVKAVRKDMLARFSKARFGDTIEASTPLKERGKRAVTEQVVGHLKKGTKGSKNVKVTSKEKKPVKGKKYSTPKVGVKGKKGKSKKSTARKPNSKVLLAARSGNRTSTKGQSPIALLTLINKVLPRELMKNMTGVYPRSLENRTGRFRQSAQVTQVIPFPQSVEIQYTYMKDPYEVFEPGSGNPLASTGRDPRRIIGGTIREIAQEMMGTKYGLVRTKRV